MADPIAELLARHMPVMSEDGRLVVGWVAVAAFVDTDGCKQLALLQSDQLASWESLGMLVAAESMVSDVEDDDDDSAS